MIDSFANKTAEDIFHGTKSKASRQLPMELHKKAARQLDQLNAAKILKDMSIPPGNRLEALKGDLVGYHSIRINDQWRIVFIWNEGIVREVQIVDYHK